MDRSYGLSDKGTNHVINFLKQRITTGRAKICQYNQRNLQYYQYNTFRNDQRQFYKDLDGKMNGQTEAPDLITRISNWKAAGPDHVQGVWFKKPTSLHPKLKQHLPYCVNAGQVQYILAYPNTLTYVTYSIWSILQLSSVSGSNKRLQDGEAYFVIQWIILAMFRYL